ncbi:MAG: hypothetical protein P1U37_00480 [Minwuia sp.]|nr:hypothetical protein [Minwuia sp.]
MGILDQTLEYALPALRKSGGKVVEKSLDVFGDRLVSFLRTRLGDEDGRRAIAKVEANPDAPSSASRLKTALQEKAEAEPAFLEELRAILKEAPPTVNQTLNQTGNGITGGQVSGNNNTVNIRGGS